MGKNKRGEKINMSKYEMKCGWLICVVILFGIYGEREVVVGAYACLVANTRATIKP